MLSVTGVSFWWPARLDLMQRLISNILLLVMFLFLSSCASSGGVVPGWVKETPESSEFVYGVGRGRMSNEENSRNASYGFAVSSLVAELYPIIDEATVDYISSDNAEAFSRIRTAATSAFASSVVRKEVWTDKVGTVWTIVSAPVRDFPSIYKESAEDYIAEIEEKRTVTLQKLEALISSLEVEGCDDGTVFFTPDALLLKEKAEKKASEIICEIDRVIDSLDIDAVMERLRIVLKREGYRLD